MQMNLKPNSRLAKAGTLFFDYLVIFAGAVLYGISVAMFTSPNDVAPGGLTGVATMLNYMFSLPIGIMIFVMNIPLFIWGFIENGKGFLTRTLVATALVSVMIDVLTPILLHTRAIQFLPQDSAECLTVSDSVLSLPRRFNRRYRHHRH